VEDEEAKEGEEQVDEINKSKGGRTKERGGNGGTPKENISENKRGRDTTGKWARLHGGGGVGGRWRGGGERKNRRGVRGERLRTKMWSSTAIRGWGERGRRDHELEE
jgi:hypothetical protein